MTQEERWQKRYEEVMKKHLVYVHEVQHWLRKRFNNDYLKINDLRL